MRNYNNGESARRQASTLKPKWDGKLVKTCLAGFVVMGVTSEDQVQRSNINVRDAHNTLFALTFSPLPWKLPKIDQLRAVYMRTYSTLVERRGKQEKKMKKQFGLGHDFTRAIFANPACS